MLAKLIYFAFVITAIIAVNTGLAIQVGGGHTYSSHSYEQTQPAPAIPQEILPVIIHHPVYEIPSGHDFIINANIKDIGMGTPIIHYRFGNNKKYATNVMKPKSPDNYEFKILAAALTDKKIEYYIEVITGSRVLATYRTADDPVAVAIKSSGGGNTILIVAILFGIAIAGVKIASSSRRTEAVEPAPILDVKKTQSKFVNKRITAKKPLRLTR